jgi:DNA-directed RNA polymerase alpha subunit
MANERVSNTHVEDMLRAALQGASDKGFELGLSAARDENRQKIEELTRRIEELSTQLSIGDKGLESVVARMRDADIEALELDGRVYSVLKRNNINTVRQLLELPSSVVGSSGGWFQFGPISLRAVDHRLARFGLRRTEKALQS